MPDPPRVVQRVSQLALMKPAPNPPVSSKKGLQVEEEERRSLELQFLNFTQNKRHLFTDQPAGF